MAEITWANIIYDLEDALEELKRLNETIATGNFPDEVEFKIAMRHIYYHLNFAWNARHVPIENINDTIKEKSDQLEKFPTDLEIV